MSGDLGYDIDQVIDYINGEANKVEDGFRFLSDGVHVGFAETANFTNGIGVTVQNGIATITPRQIGIATAGGTVGSGVSLFDFRGAGISTVTVNTSSGIGTINITGGTGNPVTSGAVTGSGNTTLTLTLNDASTVDIDVTNLRTITSIGSSTDYFYLNNGAQLSSNTHDSTAGVAFYNRKLQREKNLYSQFLVTVPMLVSGMVELVLLEPMALLLPKVTGLLSGSTMRVRMTGKHLTHTMDLLV